MSSLPLVPLRCQHNLGEHRAKHLYYFIEHCLLPIFSVRRRFRSSSQDSFIAIDGSFRPFSCIHMLLANF